MDGVFFIEYEGRESTLHSEFVKVSDVEDNQVFATVLKFRGQGHEGRPAIVKLKTPLHSTSQENAARYVLIIQEALRIARNLDAGRPYDAPDA